MSLVAEIKFLGYRQNHCVGVKLPVDTCRKYIISVGIPPSAYGEGDRAQPFPTFGKG